MQKSDQKFPGTTVEDKLKLAEEEAQNARRKEAKTTKAHEIPRIGKRRLKGGRRRSTLSPEELELLMGG